MNRLIILLALPFLFAFSSVQNPPSAYMLVMLRPTGGCGTICNNYEIVEYPQKSAEDCKKQQDSCIKKFGTTPTFFTVGPGEAVVYYKYNKFAKECDCKVLGVQKSATVAQATEEMNQKVAEERVKKPKAYHNFEIYSSWPR